MNGEKLQLEASAFADTGQWRLAIFISDTGLKALLKSLVNPNLPPIVLSEKEWGRNNPALLKAIEEAIYDNPRILDDFATSIVIDTDKTLWIPVEFTQDGEFDPQLYTMVYPVAEEDIFSLSDENQMCLFSQVAGLKSFLDRTLPGCRINSSLNVFKQWFERLENRSETPSLFSVDVMTYGERAFIFGFKNGKFVAGASHPCLDPADIAYKVMLLARAFNFTEPLTELRIMGEQERFEAVSFILEQFIDQISHLDLPSLTISDNLEPSLAILLQNE